VPQKVNQYLSGPAPRQIQQNLCTTFQVIYAQTNGKTETSRPMPKTSPSSFGGDDLLTITQ